MEENFDRDNHSVSWLECDTETKSGMQIVTCLKHTICTKFKDVLRHQRNFNKCWLTEANTMKTSNLRDHAQSEQHIYAMALLTKEHAIARGEGSTSYAPIAKALTTFPEYEKRGCARSMIYPTCVSLLWRRLRFVSTHRSMSWKQDMVSK